MELGSVILQKKTRCTACNTKLVDGTSVQVVRNEKGKIKEYRCKKDELRMEDVK